jgi:hypothetical protein
MDKDEQQKKTAVTLSSASHVLRANRHCQRIGAESVRKKIILQTVRLCFSVCVCVCVCVCVRACPSSLVMIRILATVLCILH